MVDDSFGTSVGELRTTDIEIGSGGTATKRANNAISCPKVLSISVWAGLFHIGWSEFPVDFRGGADVSLSRPGHTKIPQKGFDGWRCRRVSRAAVRNFVDSLTENITNSRDTLLVFLFIIVITALFLFDFKFFILCDALVICHYLGWYLTILRCTFLVPKSG